MSKREQVVYSLGEYMKKPGPTVTFRNLLYVVRERKFCCMRGPEKYILKDVRYDIDLIVSQYVYHEVYHFMCVTALSLDGDCDGML